MSSTLAAQNRASRTAYDCALGRASVYASTGLGSFDYLAADIVRLGSASVRAKAGVTLLRFGATRLVQGLVEKTSPGAGVFMFARQTVPDEMIRDAMRANPETQAVILGSGVDSSGLRIGAEHRAAGLAPGNFFEVDLPEMIGEKRRVASQLVEKHEGIEDSHIRYVSCTFGENELSTSLLQAGFDPGKPTIWVWSGVIHYLPEVAVKATISAMKALSTGASQLFFDFILLEAYARPEDYGFASIKKRFDAFGEVMSFGFRQDIAHVTEWLKDQGLTFTRAYTNREMVSLYEEKTGQTAPSDGSPWVNLCVAKI